MKTPPFRFQYSTGAERGTREGGQGMKRIDPEFYPMIPVIINGLIAITAIVVERLF
jgi:hypothetical protein